MAISNVVIRQQRRVFRVVKVRFSTVHSPITLKAILGTLYI